MQWEEELTQGTKVPYGAQSYLRGTKVSKGANTYHRGHQTLTTQQNFCYFMPCIISSWKFKGRGKKVPQGSPNFDYNKIFDTLFHVLFQVGNLREVLVAFPLNLIMLTTPLEPTANIAIYLAFCIHYVYQCIKYTVEVLHWRGVYDTYQHLLIIHLSYTQ